MIALLAAAALAHGPPAAAIGVAAVDADGPTHVLLTEGIGLRTDEGWKYVCPARWGGTPLAPYARGTPDAVWIPGADDLYTMDVAGRTAPTGHPELAVTGLLALADADDVLALYVDGDGRKLVRLTDQRELWSDAGSWSGLAELGGEIHLARQADDGMLEHLVLSADGDELARSEEGPIAGADPLLRVAGDALFAVDRESGRNALVSLPGASVIFEAVDSLWGPIPLGDGVVFAGDSVLWWLTDPLAQTPEVAGIGCLAARGDRRFACSRDLYDLDPAGTLIDPPILPLESLLPPDMDDLDADTAVSCWGQWRQYAFDLGIDPGDAPAAETAEPAPDEGCGCASTGSAAPPGIFLLSLGAFRYRARAAWWRARRC